MASESILKWIIPNKSGLFCKSIRKGSLMSQPIGTEWKVMRKIQHSGTWSPIPFSVSARSFFLRCIRTYWNLLLIMSYNLFFTLFFLIHLLHFFIMNFNDSSPIMCSVIATEGSLTLRQLCLRKWNLEFPEADTLVRGCQSLSHLKPFWTGL